MSLAERLLIARLIERDEQAFGEIVRQYGDKVFSLIYRMLGNRQEAEDVAQDVFITVFKTIDSFPGRGEVLDLAAAHRRQPRQEPDQAPGAPADRRVDPDDVSQVKVSNDRPGPPVQSRIESPDKLLEGGRERTTHTGGDRNLPEDQRLLVVLRDVEELSYQEIEEITGLPEGHDKIALAPRAHGSKGVVG
jgi:RNA polymerase sigma-70 factor (ECF subfamily)